MEILKSTYFNKFGFIDFDITAMGECRSSGFLGGSGNCNAFGEGFGFGDADGFEDQSPDCSDYIGLIYTEDKEELHCAIDYEIANGIGDSSCNGVA